MATIHGYAIVFNSESADLGGFTEIIAPRALDRTVREKVDLRALVNHDPGRVLGRMSAGTLRAAQDSKGLHVTIDAPDTGDGRDVVELVRRGDISGQSFGFRVLEDEWTDRRGDLPQRTVRDLIAREVSATPWPAYESTTLSLRSLTLTRSLLSARLAKADRDGARFALERRSTEFALARTGDGVALEHDEAKRSLARFREAKKHLGARRPVDANGAPLVFRSRLTADGWRGGWCSRSLTLGAALSRQIEVAKMIDRRWRP